jgi:hypothetical protein
MKLLIGTRVMIDDRGTGVITGIEDDKYIVINNETDIIYKCSEDDVAPFDEFQVSICYECGRPTYSQDPFCDACQ